MEKIISFKFKNINGPIKLDAKQLSVALEGINEIILDSLLELEGVKDNATKKQITEAKVGVEFDINQGSIELLLDWGTINNILVAAASISVIADVTLKDLWRAKIGKENNLNGQLPGFETTEADKKNKLNEILNSKIDSLHEAIKTNKKVEQKNSFTKIAPIININMNFGIQTYKNDNVIKNIEIEERDKHLFINDHRDSGIVLEELKHGAVFEEEGKITKGNSKSNSVGFLYKDTIIDCYGGLDTKKIESIFYQKAKLRGIVDRKYNKENHPSNEDYLEKKPRINFELIEYINVNNSNSQKTLFKI